MKAQYTGKKNDKDVCPESTIESVNSRATIRAQKVDPIKSSRGMIVCESTIDSSLRRDFIRKAALTTVAASGVGAALLGGNLQLRRASANSDRTNFGTCKLCVDSVAACSVSFRSNLFLGCKFCTSPFTVTDGVGCILTHGGITAFGSIFAGAGLNVGNATSPANLFVAGEALLYTLCVLGCIPLMARYTRCGIDRYAPASTNNTVSSLASDKSSLIQFENGDTTVVDWNLGVSGVCNSLDVPDGSFYLQHANPCINPPALVVNKCGMVGIGTLTPTTPLNVVGSSPLVGTLKNNATSGDRSSLLQFANGDTTAVDWNVGVAGLCNSIKVPDGDFYLQHSTSSTPAISVNKCNNHVGIGISNPCRVLCVNGRIHTQCGMGLGTQTINTTLAINGSLSMKSRQVSSTATLALSDYAVVADAASAAFTITLPAVSSTAGACNGMVLFIKKVDSSTNSVTIAASGTDTIEGNSSIVLKKQYDSLQLVSNNSSGRHEWFILQSAKCGVAVS
jgi:hypothetical protein